MSKYVRVTKSKYEGGTLVPADQVNEYITGDKQHYVSTYFYDKSHFDQFQKTKSVKGFTGVTTNKIWFDFDSKDEIEKARFDTLEVIARLKASGIKEENIQIYFSGNKGYNVVVELNRELTQQQAQSIAINKFAKNLDTFDHTLYDGNQILRVAGTKHEVSGLYKIPLTVEEIREMTSDEIKLKAKSLDNVGEFDWNPATVSEEFVKVEEPPLVVKIATAAVQLERPRHWKDYKWALLQGDFEIGERHHALMVLAATCRGLGYPEALATAMLESADEQHCIRTGDKPCNDLKSNIIPSVYSEGWNGGQFSAESDPWLQKYVERKGFQKQDLGIVKILDVKADFDIYVQNIEQNTVKTGIPCLDKAMPITTGMMLGLVGAASSGKTALALKMLKNTSLAGITSVFASLDMHRTRLFEKLIYSETGLSRDALYGDVKNGMGEKHYSQVEKNYENVFFYDRSAASVPNIRKYIEQVQESTGRKVKMLMVDYFERVGADRSDETAASKEVAGALQDLCNDMDLCIIVIVQPNKFSLGGGPESPILNYTAIKGSSFLYQSFRSIISIWRPFFTPEWKRHDKYMQMAILKNDLGEQDLFSFSWDGKRGDIKELEESKYQEMKDLLTQKANEKAEKEAKNDAFGF